MTTAGLTSVLSWMHTTEHRRQLVESLQGLLSDPSTKQRSLSKQRPPSTLPWYIQPLWSEIVSTSTKKSNSKQLLSNIESFISSLHNLPVASLTLAFTPTSQQLEKYLSLLRAQIDESVIVEVHYDDSIIGGAILSLNGQRYESTILQKISAVIANKN